MCNMGMQAQTGTKAIWEVQQLLHKKNAHAVPIILLLLAGSLIVHSHVQGDHFEVKHFFMLIILQMIPLVVLECKIASCTDPVTLFCKFGQPVTVMHVIFCVLRSVQSILYEGEIEWSTILGFLGACLTLFAGFNQTLSMRGLFQNSALWKLVLVSLVAAFFTEGLVLISSRDLGGWKVITDHATEYLGNTFAAAGGYVEIVSFVPGILMMYQDDNTGRKFEVDNLDSHNSAIKKMATWFFLFLIGFYIIEDLYSAYEMFSSFQGIATAHVLHFLLVADFAVYVLAHVYCPEKLVGELKRWLPVDLSCSV